MNLHAITPSSGSRGASCNQIVAKFHSKADVRVQFSRLYWCTESSGHNHFSIAPLVATLELNRSQGQRRTNMKNCAYKNTPWLYRWLCAMGANLYACLCMSLYTFLYGANETGVPKAVHAPQLPSSSFARRPYKALNMNHQTVVSLYTSLMLHRIQLWQNPIYYPLPFHEYNADSLSALRESHHIPKEWLRKI
jgi:hypothetical protein